MKIIIILVILTLIVEVVYKPRLDFTREGKLVLWYGRNVREYWILF